MAKKILIVEDDEDLRSMLVSILQFSDYEVSEAATGTEAIEKAISGPSRISLFWISNFLICAAWW